MHARSAVFDLYGDHLRARGGVATIAALMRLLAPLGITGPAVRTAISRMVAQGWLCPVDLPEGKGYATTDQARRRLDEARARVYRHGRDVWPGTWHQVVVTSPAGRSRRARLRSDLGYLGYAPLAADTWVSPHASPDLDETLARAGVSAVTGNLHDVVPPAAPLAAWDLTALRAAYDGWLGQVDHLVAQHLAQHPDPDEAAYAARFHLVHEWRKFLFSDPGLPPALLPDDWPGRPAAEAFDRHADRLRTGTDRFTARCLGSM